MILELLILYFGLLLCVVITGTVLFFFDKREGAEAEKMRLKEELTRKLGEQLIGSLMK